MGESIKILPTFCSSINKPLVLCSKEFYLMCAGVFTIFMKNAESAGMGLTAVQWVRVSLTRSYSGGGRERVRGSAALLY